MFGNRTAINRDTALGGNAPFQPQTTVINGRADTPGGATKRLFPFTLTSQDPVFKIPVAWNWNATFQQDVGWGTTVELSYVGRRGIHNQRKRNINQLLPGTTQANRGVNVNALRPYLGLGMLGLAENSGLSTYNGLQLSVERRFSKGFQFGATWVRRIFGNWEISAVYQAQSGTPFSVRYNVDYAGVGAGSGDQFWNLVGDPSMEPTEFTNSAVWFNKAAFAAPAAGTFGEQPRNSLRNPGFWNIDAGLRKNFPTVESQLLQFRFEVFDMLNHPNWSGATSNPTSGSFGLVTGKSGNRMIQLAVKYIF